MRERCYGCFRPVETCFCAEIPRICNRTSLLILQHLGERSHPFNTARIVQRAMRDCRVVTEHNRRFAAERLGISDHAGLLYPRAEAPLLADVPPAERPQQLVVVDGTWHQAKTIVRDVPQLRGLPCFRLSPATPGEYRIRREPSADSLSTLEAIVAALRALEPETAGLDQLVLAFRKMIDDHLAHRGSFEAWRRKTHRTARPRHVPQLLLSGADQLVIAYGEATPRKPGQRVEPTPLSWVAERLDSSDRFSERIRPPALPSPAAMNHMRLSAGDFSSASTPEEFAGRWQNFLRPGDTLVVYHQRTSRLLTAVDAQLPRCLVLKSMFRQWRKGFRSLEELLQAEGLSLPPGAGSRADQRLEMAVGLVNRLRAQAIDHVVCGR